MCLIHDDFSQITFWNQNSILEEKSIFVINVEALVFGNALVDTTVHLFHHGIQELCLTNLVFQSRRDVKVGEESLRNNLQIKFAESFTKLGLIRLENQAVAISLPAQCVSNHIGLAWSILDTRIILLNHFDPTSLPEVEIRLSEDVLETLMISENIHFSSQ